MKVYTYWERCFVVGPVLLFAQLAESTSYLSLDENLREPTYAAKETSVNFRVFMRVLEDIPMFLVKFLLPIAVFARMTNYDIFNLSVSFASFAVVFGATAYDFL